MQRSPGTCSAGGSTASSLPRSTSTVRGSLPCWMTPATMSPSRPAYSPKVSSSSTSRRRCRMTWRAVVAAIRPNPAGVSSYSWTTAPSGPVWMAQTVTWPLLRSTSTRAATDAPSDLWYATSSASSMALMAWSSEMSFSLSRLRSTLRSMSIAGRSKLARRMPELQLDRPRAQDGVGETAAGTLDVQGHPVGVGRGDPAGHGPGTARIGHRDLDQPSHRAAPVPVVGQRAVHAGRGDLERVREISHHGHRVERGGQLAADRRGVVQAHAPVAVHHHAQQPAPAGGGPPSRFQVHAGRGDPGPDDIGDPVLVDRGPARLSGRFDVFYVFYVPARSGLGGSSSFGRAPRLGCVPRTTGYHDLLVHDLRDWLLAYPQRGRHADRPGRRFVVKLIPIG